jgi:hypothetical protein
MWRARLHTVRLVCVLDESSPRLPHLPTPRVQPPLLRTSHSTCVGGGWRSQGGGEGTLIARWTSPMRYASPNARSQPQCRRITVRW